MEQYRPTLEERKEHCKREMERRVLDYINCQIPDRYSDYIDVEATANSTVAPAEWITEARAIAQWFYGMFQALEAKQAEIDAMTEEELNAFDLQAWLDSLPKRGM